VEAFAAKFNENVTVTYTTSQKSIIHDLTPFCKFEAYGDRHYGSVWRNHNSNVAAVVQPAIISFTQTQYSDLPEAQEAPLKFALI
jgi:hypothetical protein